MRPIQRVLILGGGYAGLVAAARLAEVADEASITLLDARAEFTQRLRLHEMLAGSTPESAPYSELLEPKGIRFRQGRVEKIDVAQRCVKTIDSNGSTESTAYDLLIVALGSSTGAPLPGIAEFATRLNDPQEITLAAGRIAKIAERQGSVLVAGGGLTGIETASELAERYPGLKLTLLTRDSIANAYSAAGERHIRATLQRLGVQVIENRELTRFEEGRAFTRNDSMTFDLAIWTGGFVPPPIGRISGLPVDAAGGILVDERLQVFGHPEIFVAGDAASANASWGHLRMGCVTATPMGAFAGDNARRLLRAEPLETFDFAFPGRNLSLGRREGLIQMTDFRDLPTGTILTGRLATIIKEGICKATFRAPQWELKSGLHLIDIFSRKVPAGAQRQQPDNGTIEWQPTAKAR